MKVDKRKNYFSYVGEISKDVMEEIHSAVENTASIWKISNLSDGKEIATRLNEIVDSILDKNQIPKVYSNIEDVAVGLGVLFGHSLCIGYNWKWKALGDNSETASYFVVSPEDNFCNAPMPYLLKILTRQNLNFDGTNDNTVLLLYNMLKNIDQKPEKEKYVPLA